MNIDIKSKLREWRRVIQVARKPSKDEYTGASKICIIGIIIIGIIGFLIFLAFAFLGI